MILDSKRKLFEQYDKAFQAVAGVKLVKEPEACKSNYWVQTLLLSKDRIDQRDSILRATNDVGFMTRPAWAPLHQLPPYQRAPRMELLETRFLANGLINLPSSISGRDSELG